MSSCNENPAYSGNPDKEAMYAARRAMRDQAVRELAEAEAEVLGNVTESDISKLKVKVQQLRHACAKYLVSYSWMTKRIGGSITYDTYPETRAEADAAIDMYQSRRIDFENEFPSFRGAHETGRFSAYENMPEWWDSVCC